MKRFVVASALFIAISPAVAQTPPVTPPSAATDGAAQAAKPKRERMICENQVDIGSRLAKSRVCMTESQWKQHQLDTQGQLDQSHMNTQGRGGPG